MVPNSVIPSTNPYAAPQADPEIDLANLDPRRAVESPARLLLLLSTGWASLLLGFLVCELFLLAADLQQGYLSAGQREFAVLRLYCLGFVAILNMLVCWGAIQMRALANYRSARLAAILALIPLAGLFFVFSMPVGLRALRLLSQPKIKSAFRS